jgi:hypothetical protein
MNQHNAEFRGRKVFTVAKVIDRNTWHQLVFNDRDQFVNFRRTDGRFHDIVAINCARGRCTKVIDFQWDDFERFPTEEMWGQRVRIQPWAFE